uniref:Syndecan/Neurexin domain-containing protein n=1 Tax=Monopterus albus TaxID=43700 RepID=A0A3Q3KG13_MONAL
MGKASLFYFMFMFTAIIAGSVTGVILAAVLTGLLIYKWYKQDDGGYIMGQRSLSKKNPTET